MIISMFYSWENWLSNWNIRNHNNIVNECKWRSGRFIFIPWHAIINRLYKNLFQYIINIVDMANVIDMIQNTMSMDWKTIKFWQYQNRITIIYVRQQNTINLLLSYMDSLMILILKCFNIFKNEYPWQIRHV